MPDTAAEGNIKNTDLPAFSSGFLAAIHVKQSDAERCDVFSGKTCRQIGSLYYTSTLNMVIFLSLVASLPYKDTVLWGGFVSWLQARSCFGPDEEAPKT